ncbi:DgyrCDS13780 [Dimorphilus gyrociliatus]|uniref:DgyrCDS13780 n=1 Tax=Dimorphilus gyrociliatus TaxID=2664684 RepID=A0A7I8WBS0_9ANNE|nr:DgyrCDS13780 [Dimorphilus gyrociliatus]
MEDSRTVKVYIVKNKKSPEIPATFGKCLLAELGWTERQGHCEMEIYAKITCNKLVLSKHRFYDAAKVQLHHNYPCNAWDHSHIDAKTIHNRKYVTVRLNVLMETAENKILLQRKSLANYIYPLTWTLPGDSLEANETVWECALKNFKYNCGIQLNKDLLHDVNLPLLYIWESIYPFNSTEGYPIRHDAIVFTWLKLKDCQQIRELSLNFQPDLDYFDAFSFVNVELVASLLVRNKLPNLTSGVMNLSKDLNKFFK